MLKVRDFTNEEVDAAHAQARRDAWHLREHWDDDGDNFTGEDFIAWRSALKARREEILSELRAHLARKAYEQARRLGLVEHTSLAR